MSRRRLGLRKRLALNIFSELYASTVREHRLDTLFWECTLRCNLSCRHCGSDCRVDPGVADMPLADFLNVLDEEVTPHASTELLLDPDQREYMYHRIREIRAMKGGKPIFAFDFQNDGEYVGGCIAGGRNYCHINPNGDVEPCVFIHYSGANIKEVDLLTALKQPLFMAYRANQPFNCNHLKPCPMLENPEILQHMVHETGAHSTDLQSPESVEHLCGKCAEYAKNWDAP